MMKISGTMALASSFNHCTSGLLRGWNCKCIWHKPTFLSFFVYFFVEMAFSVYVLGD